MTLNLFESNSKTQWDPIHFYIEFSRIPLNAIQCSAILLNNIEFTGIPLNSIEFRWIPFTNIELSEFPSMALKWVEVNSKTQWDPFQLKWNHWNSSQ